MLKLNIDPKKIEQARDYAEQITNDMQWLIDWYSSTTIERTVLRLFGVDGATADGTPIPNVFVDYLRENKILDKGAAYHLCNAMAYTGLSAQETAEMVINECLLPATQSQGQPHQPPLPRQWGVGGGIPLSELPPQDPTKVFEIMNRETDKMLEHISRQKAYRDGKRSRCSVFGVRCSDTNVPSATVELENRKPKTENRPTPRLYVIVATGNIYDDVVQAKAAARQGADIIAVIRSTAQSLLDYVPYGATTEGFGGTFATQENFRIMRAGLDEVGEELGRYICLTNYASGLCMPEIAAMGAIERLDLMLNDAMYGILFRDVNPLRTLLDQYFSRMINAFADIEIQTGEDNYLTTADAVEKAYTVTASQLINEQFALMSGVKPERMGIGHAFEINPDMENGFLYEIAHAMLTKELFPNSPIKYMPPTKHQTGDIFKAYIVNAMFNFVAQLTGQGVQLLGMLTEAVHTPHLQDRALAIENANYIFNTMKDLNNELVLSKNSFINERANLVLDQAIEFLSKVADEGLLVSMANGDFADIKRTENGGKGLDGVFKKAESYVNPFMEKMRDEVLNDTGERNSPLNNSTLNPHNLELQTPLNSQPSTLNTVAKPYGDTLNDGRMQLSFSMPVPCDESGKEAAKVLLKQMGFDNIEVCFMGDMSQGFTRFVAYANTSVTVDLSKIHIKVVETDVMTMEETDDFIFKNIGRELVVVGACIESDAHTVGIDAIMNMKGYNHRYGLERYKGFFAHNLGASVPCEELLRKAREVKADAILVSQIVTQKDIHIKNLTRLIELAEAEGVRDKMLFICGGPRLNHELAIELGYDAGFGAGSYATNVASFIAVEMEKRVNR